MGETVDEKRHAKQDATGKPSDCSLVLDVHIDQPFIREHGQAGIPYCPPVVSTPRKEDTTHHQSKENTYITSANRHLIATDVPRTFMVLMAIQIRKGVNQTGVRIQFSPRERVMLVHCAIGMLMERTLR
ncbi:MAG: hypothetical protein MG2_0642 [uncultured Candidatus Poseidoniales archaeon]|nr:MAG: hypothetical protein MG2_0642 [uncultured Candidatus Poseidoniales archaeon]